ncbi:MAG: M28 family peptidase [Kangiellaceae bacterium]
MISKSSIYKTAIFIFIMIGYLLVFQQFKTIDATPFESGGTNEIKNNEGFNAKRAFEDLSHLLLINNKEQPHPVDSIENEIVAKRIISTMRSLGYQEEIQKQEFCLDHKNGSAKCALINNIIFRLNGSTHANKTTDNHSNQAILLSAHYDSVNAAPGASDAGTAVATLIEIARLLSDKPQARNDIVFLFNDGEEAGLLGARAFMENHPYAKEIKWVLNLDAIGSSGRSLMIETDNSNAELTKVFAKVTEQSSPSPIASSFISFLWENMPSDTDMTIFKKHGLSGLNFINLEGSAHYHTPLDNLQNVDLGSLQEHGNNLWLLIEELKNKPIESNTSSEQAFYQDIIGYGVIQWKQAIGIFASVISLVLLLTILVLMKKDIYKFWYSFISTLFILVFILVVAIISAVALKKGIQFVSFKINGTAEPWFSQFLPMQFFLIAGIFTILVLSYELVKNYVCYPLLVLLLPIALCIIATLSAIFIPKASAIFIISSVLYLITLTPLFITQFRNSFIAERKLYRFTGIILASISILIFTPSLYLLEVMMSFYWTPVIGFFIAIIFVNAVSLAYSGSQNNSLVARKNKSLSSYIQQLELISLDKLALGCFFVACFFWLLLTPVYTTNTPNSLNLQYLQVNSTGQPQAFILAESELEKLNFELHSNLKTNGEIIISKTKPWSSNQYINKPIESLELKPISIKVLTNEIKGDSRFVTIQLESENKSINDIKIFMPLNAKLKTIRTASNSINYTDDNIQARDFYGFHCIGKSCANLTLNIETEIDTPFNLKLIETRKGLPPSLNNLNSLRGDKLIEKGKGDRQVISQELRL